MKQPKEHAMQVMPMFIAPQYLETASRALASELSPVLDLLRYKLMLATAREYAELREAKALIKIMKYEDFSQAVRADDMAWALHHARETLARDGHLGAVLSLEKAAQLLSLDPKSPHPMPADLARRISNELALQPRLHHRTLAQAV